MAFAVEFETLLKHIHSELDNRLPIYENEVILQEQLKDFLTKITETTPGEAFTTLTPADIHTFLLAIIECYKHETDTLRFILSAAQIKRSRRENPDDTDRRPAQMRRTQ